MHRELPLFNMIAQYSVCVCTVSYLTTATLKAIWVDSPPDTDLHTITFMSYCCSFITSFTTFGAILVYFS